MPFTSPIVAGNVPVIQEPAQFCFVIHGIVNAFFHLVAVLGIVRIQRVDHLEIFVQQWTDFFIPASFPFIGGKITVILLKIS